jgi:hypothetical protein
MIPSAPTQTVFGRRSPSRRGATSRPGPFDRLGLGLDRRLEPAALFPRPERWSSPRPIEMRRRSAAASTVFWSLSSVTSRQASSRTPSVWAVRGSRPRAASRGTTSVPQPLQRKRPRRSSISPTSLTRRRGAQPFAFIEAPQAVQAAGTTRSASRRANELTPEGHPGLGAGDGDRPLERADVGMLGRQANRERHRTRHREPLRLLVVVDDQTACRLGLPFAGPPSTEFAMLTRSLPALDGTDMILVCFKSDRE